MKAKLIVEGKEFDIEINDPKLQELVTSKKQTGYERVEEDVLYFYNGLTAGSASAYEDLSVASNAFYDSANYYSNKTVAENNARADKLMRQLRRFAVEHREKDIDWKNTEQYKYGIYYNFRDDDLAVCDIYCIRGFGYIPFDSKETAELAIETFHDELIWYFTEYKDSL